MADETTQTPNPQNGEQNQPQDKPMGLNIGQQYIKDLSFERCAQDTQLGDDAPSVNIEVGVQSKILKDNIYETSLRLKAETKVNDQTAFIIELVYAAAVTLMNIPDEQRDAVLSIEIPRQIFPFARRILAETVRDGAFPPLLIDPIDFADLYRRNLEAVAESKARPQADA